MNAQVLTLAALVVAARWVARLWSLASVGFVLLFVVGEAFSPGPRQLTLRDSLLLLCFPGAVCGGLLLAWRWEVLGGSVTMLGLAGLYVLNFLFSGKCPGGPWFILIAAPGVIFLIAGVLSMWLTARSAPV